MLKYGPGSHHSQLQPLHDLCPDLHCHRDRYTWTSHPALEGTMCGSNKVMSFFILQLTMLINAIIIDYVFFIVP